MNFSPNNVQLANNPQFGKGFDVKKIFKPYPLITDRNLHPLTECVNHLVQEILGPEMPQFLAKKPRTHRPALIVFISRFSPFFIEPAARSCSRLF